ncbi:MAG: hypothetical protein ACI36Z_00375 [Alloprevotella sp.]
MYQENKQTVADLAASLRTSPSTIKRRLRNVAIEWEQPPLTGHGFVHLDATYWGRNTGVLAALDSQTGKILYLAFIKHERASDYQDAVTSIENRGYKIDGIIIDGLQSLYMQFSRYNIQYTDVSIPHEADCKALSYYESQVVSLTGIKCHNEGFDFCAKV